MLNKNSKLGIYGEDLACCFLIGKDYNIIKRNVRFSNLEIDIIAFKNGTYWLVEVKTRLDKLAGSAQDHLSRNKIKNLKRAAVLMSINEHIPLKSINLAFIAIDINSQIKMANIKHFFDII